MSNSRFALPFVFRSLSGKHLAVSALRRPSRHRQPRQPPFRVAVHQPPHFEPPLAKSRNGLESHDTIRPPAVRHDLSSAPHLRQAPLQFLDWNVDGLWVAKTPSRRKQTQSIDAKRDVREGGSDCARKEWAADRGLPHLQKRQEATGTFGPASAGAAKAVPLKLPGAGNDDAGHQPRAAR
jgi:hypothetical protein